MRPEQSKPFPAVPPQAYGIPRDSTAVSTTSVAFTVTVVAATGGRRGTPPVAGLAWPPARSEGCSRSPDSPRAPGLRPPPAPPPPPPPLPPPPPDAARRPAPPP